MLQNKAIVFAEPERNVKGHIFAVIFHLADSRQVRLQSRQSILSIVSKKEDGGKMGALPLFQNSHIQSLLLKKDEKGEIEKFSFYLEDKTTVEIDTLKGKIDVFAYDDESKRWEFVHPSNVQ